VYATHLADNIDEPLARCGLQQPVSGKSASPNLWPCHRARHGTLNAIQQVSAALPLPRFDTEPIERYPYGARSEAAVYVADLLCTEVPGLCEPGGELEIVAIARRPGVLSKVAIRPRVAELSPRRVGIGADDLARVSQQLDGERIQVVRWQQPADAYIADALGLADVPPVLLLPWLRHARVLLGEIDLRGIAGWRGLNTILASSLTGWRIRLESVAHTTAWVQLEKAMRARRPVLATVVGHTARGTRLEVRGLVATLSRRIELPPGHELEVRITRMDPDEGRIFVSDRLGPRQQLSLF
jgi:transcription antitermination factor NusA-like protein